MGSKPEDAAAPRRTSVFALSLLSLATIAIAGSTLPAGSSPARAAATTSEVTIARAGYGDIRVDGPGGKLILTCTSELDAKDEKIGCPLSVPAGTALTFRAIPRPVEAIGTGTPSPSPAVLSEFVGWSRPECKSTGPCAFKAAAGEEWIVAQFSPVWLEALVNGAGTVDAGGHRQTCADFTCEMVMGLYKAGEPVTVTGGPTKTGATTKWGFGCDPFESDLGSGRCVVNISDARNFFSVGFDGSDPDPRPPFNQVVHLEVERAGDGQGQIQGSGKSAALDDAPWSIDCGSACDFDRLQYQTQVRLRAVKAAGSVFDSWSGPPCLSEDTCTFTVGRYPKVVAIFKKAQSFNATVLAATATGTGSTRAVVTSLRTNGAARANLRLLRNGRRLSQKSFDVAAGTRSLTVPVPRSVKPGWCALSVEVVAADGTKRTFRKWLRLGP